MSLLFQSICSGSSGNCLLLRSGSTTLLVDAGFRSIRGCRAALEDLLPTVDGVVVSHLHGDHIQYSSLRVLEEFGVPVHVHEGDLGLLARKHFKQWRFGGLKVRPFTASGFRVGDFAIRPFEVPHDGAHRTFGFEVALAQRGSLHRVVLATDLRDWRGLAPWFQDADFICVEANYDPELLLENPNPNSRFHLPNAACGALLRHALARSEKRPVAVMLGHLSEERNRPAIARETVLGILGEGGLADIPLHVAPRHEPSQPIRILG